MSYSMYPSPRPPIYSRGQFVFLVIVALLLIVGSGLLVYTTITNQTAASNANATATAQDHARQTALAQTRTARVAFNATATAQANLTTTAQANANATATANAQATAIAAARATSTAQANPTANPQAFGNPNPYPPYTGTLVLDDPLYNNSQGHGWDVYSLPVNNNCQFVGGAYESTSQNQSGSFYDISNMCMAEKTNFRDFTFQVDMTLLKGMCGGLAFRGNSKTANMYVFEVCESTTVSAFDFRDCVNGTYSAFRKREYSSAIHKSYGQTNVLAVVAIGNTITLYANGQKLTTVTDSNFSAGQIGLVTSGYPGVLEVATFRNARVWTQ